MKNEEYFKERIKERITTIIDMYEVDHEMADGMKEELLWDVIERFVPLWLRRVLKRLR